MSLLNLQQVLDTQTQKGNINECVSHGHECSILNKSEALTLEQTNITLLAKFVNQMVASTFGIPPESLFIQDRANLKAVRARQISIYLMHTALSFPLTRIASIYEKDRTTVGYACRVVEDLRDKPAFDDQMIELENTIKTVLSLTTFTPEKRK